MTRLLAQLAQVWAVLMARVDVGPRQCDGCGHTCTQVPRTTYDAWLYAREMAPAARMRHGCGGALRKVGLDTEVS